jgi:large subunit ribosomal protein L2
MKLKKLNPTTNGARHTIKIQKNLLAKNNRLLRSILKKKKNSGGRSSLNGRTTVWHKGGAVKSLYRTIDSSLTNANSIVLTNCYDPNRNAFVTLNFELQKKNFFFNTAPDSVYPGSLIKNSSEINELKLGYRTKIKNIPTGSIIHNLTSNNGSDPKYIRSAGTYGQIVQCGLKKARVKLPSKTVIEVSIESFATIGIVSNTQSNLTTLGKAGVNRHKGIRPTTRGIAMNPVDHPHGGRTNGGRPSVSPWGVPTKSGFYLRKRKKR